MTVQNLEMVSGDAVVLEITVLDQTTQEAVNLAGCTATFVMAYPWTGTVVVTKTTSDGVTVTDATAGRVDVELIGSDTDLLEGDLKYELQITDSANNRSTPLYGTITLVSDLIDPSG
jgi:hypothetical protein